MSGKAAVPSMSCTNGRARFATHAFIIHALLFVAVLGPPLRSEPHAGSDPAAQSGRLSVAVLWLEDRTSDPNLDHWSYTGSLLVRDQLGKIKSLRVLSDGAIGYAFRQTGVRAGDRVDPNTARRMAEHVEARRAVWGRYRQADGQWRVDAWVMNAATGSVSKGLSAAASDWFDVGDQLTEQILAELGVTPTAEERAKMAKRWARSPEALDWHGRLYLDQEQGKPVPHLEALCRKMIAADPDCARAHVNLACTLASQGDFASAEEAVQRALQLDPNMASAHGVLGRMAIMQRRYDQARDELRQACRLDSNDAGHLTALAQVYEGEGKRDEAIALLEIAVTLDRTDATAHAVLAETYAARNRQEEALRELEEARHYLPEGLGAANALLAIAEVHAALHRYSEAIDGYERALAMARELATDPAVIRTVEWRIQRTRSALKPTFIDAAMPERYTAEALETIFRDRLTETERQLIANPFLCTEPMKQWAHELTRGATTDLDKAKAIFDGLATRRGASGRLRSRTAREVFDAWKDTDATLVCMDHAVLLTALLRAVDVNAFFVNVTKDPGGKVINHACAAVFTGDRTILVDSMQRWFGAPHQEYAILNDLETTAFLCFNNQFGDPMELAGYRAGLKLWPDSILGRLVLISALYRTRQSEEGHRILDAIAAAPSNDYTAAFYWRTRGLVEEDKRNWERAMEYQRKATSIDPHNATAHYHLGRLHLDRGHPAEAREAFRTCLRNNPDPMIADIVRRQLIQINEQIGSAGAVAPASSKSDAP